MGGTALPDLNELLIFARVVERGGISAAARPLGLPKSTVSRRVSALEERLGVRLLERTSRASRPTEVGRLLYERCRRIVSDAESVAAIAASTRDAPRGILRVTAPLVLGRTVLGTLVAAYGRRYPDVRVHVDVTNRTVDLVEEGFDVALRAGPLADSSLVARALGAVNGRLYAAPALLARHPVRRPEDLQDAPVVVLGRTLDGGKIELRSGDRSVTVAVAPRVVANDLDVVRDAARRGLGVTALPRLLAEAGRAKGLRVVLPGWTTAPTPIHALFPSHKSVSPAIRAFVDLAAAHFRRWTT